MALYNSSTAIRRGTLTTYDDPNLCVFTRTSESETVLMMSNLRNNTVSYTLPAGIANKVWTNALTNETVSLTGQISLSPFQYLVLKR